MNITTAFPSQVGSQPGPEGLSLSIYTRWLNEIALQPVWRHNADRHMDYVDGNQLDSDILRKMREIGMPPAIEPLIGPAVDSVLGLEAKTRTDWRVTPDDSAGGDDVAAALNFKLNQAERKSGADKACSDAFKPQFCVGIGWVEVARETDPFKFPYRCVGIHRNEIFWDMLDREPGLPKARYLMRRRWTDAEQARLKFPGAADIISHSMGRWTEQYQLTLDGSTTTNLATAWDQERGWSIEEQEWRDVDAGRVCLTEVWYRRWVQITVLRLPDGRVVEYNDKLASHVIAVAQGYAKPQKAVVAKMFLSFWMGPHKLQDGPTPYKHQDFPYVQFVGKVEDRTGIPLGAVKGAIYLQDNVNSAISKIRWGLSATRTIRTKGAYSGSDEDFRQMASRVDADIVLNATEMSKPGAVFKVERDFQLTEQQYKMLQDSRLGIERALGIPSGFQGQKGTATSGVQESAQIEQATQTLASTMDNFRFARAKVGELLLSMIIEDMIGKPETVVVKGNQIRDDREIRLNTPTTDPATGFKYLDNDVERIRLKVAMNEVPSTPSFRTQQLAAMSEAFKSMPPQYQEVALPHLLSLMDVPNRQELMEDIKNAKDQLTPDMVEQKIKAAVDLALKQSDHDIRRRELDLKYSPDKLLAEIQKLINEAVKAGAEGSFASMQAAAQLAANPAIAPVADSIMQTSGWREPNPAGQDPNFAVPAEPIATPGMPSVVPNTSPQLPPVAQEPSAMTGIETARTTDNLPQGAMP